VNVTVIETADSIFDGSLREMKRTDEQEFPCHYLSGVRRHDRLIVITSCEERLTSACLIQTLRHVTPFHVSYVSKIKKKYIISF
jgi:hypothetical protein